MLFQGQTLAFLTEIDFELNHYFQIPVLKEPRYVVQHMLDRVIHFSESSLVKPFFTLFIYNLS